jgi:hypothetical protein
MVQPQESMPYQLILFGPPGTSKATSPEMPKQKSYSTKAMRN